uniref:Uncharacterized protein n=1 Tax=viral metagenome TaxID=1070528 RepID=A0A6H2A3T3_9ZZZZ
MCVHYWFIDDKNYGKCIKCPAEKDFQPGIDKYESKFTQSMFDSEYDEETNGIL